MPGMKDFKAHGLFEQADSTEHFYFHGLTEGLAYEKIFKAYVPFAVAPYRHPVFLDLMDGDLID